MPVDDRGQYTVGVATADITPTFGVPLSGFAARAFHSSTGVYHPLRAVAITIDDGDSAVLLLSAEWLGFYDQAPRVRGRISQATGLPESHIVLSGSHTHCGPAVRLKDREDHGWIDEDYLNGAIESMARAAAVSRQYRYPATLNYAVGRCGFAVNRRSPDPDTPGRVRRAMTPNPDGPTDHEVGVLVVRSVADDAVRAVAFNYACHPTSRAGLHVGGDYVSFAYDHLDAAFPGAQPSFLQGCGGDQKPCPPEPGATSFGQRTLEQVRDIGRELGRSVEGAVTTDSPAVLTGPIAVQQAVITLETEPATMEALQAGLRPDAPAYQQRWASRLLELVDAGLPQPTQVPFEVQTITFGRSLAMVTMSGEMTVEHGLRLKRELTGHFDHVMPLAYTNEMCGYVPVRRQFDEYGYEVLDSNQHHGRTGRYVETTEDQIHTRIHRMLGL